MSLERGTRPGGPRTDEPADNGTRIAIAAVLVGAALVLSIVLAIGALTPGAGTSASPVPSPSASPVPSPSASPEPSPTVAPTASPEPSASSEPIETPVPVDTPEPSTPVTSLEPSAPPTVAPTRLPTVAPTVRPTPTPTTRPTPTPEATPRPTPRPTRTPAPTPAAGDPGDLPRYPGSRLVDRERGRSGDLATLNLEYTTPARLDRVRRHYRTMLRRHDWFVGDVEFDDDEWEIEANKGQREVAIELKREGNRTEVEIELSWPTE